jgi:hypothetical protein
MSDYISREELLKDLYSREYTNFQSRDFIALVQYQDKADVRENIHGEWIPKERTTECSIDIDIVCSRCGFVGVEGYAHGYELNEINIQKVRDYIKELDMNFCTCCGADMRGE